jgi:hypothetical protein
MAKTLIDRIKESLSKEGLTPRTNASRDWLRAKVKVLRPTADSLMSDKARLRDKSFIGRMYFYFYDPKTKKTMPYYDKFPLVIPIESYADGFLGLNLHYIHPKQRIILLDKLSTMATNNKYDEKTRLILNYQYLASTSKIYETTPCIKRYLFSHIGSRFLEISADEWDIAALIPGSGFVGASNSKVWSDSKKKI